MSTKFEQLLDLLVNEEMDKANELFHEIVVDKSREIYENLIAEEDEEEMDESAEDEEMDESAEDEEMDEGYDEEADESVDLEDSYMMDGDDEEDDLGGDATDDLGGDIGAMDDEPEMGGEESSEDSAIFDIKNAIADLEAAFAELEQAQGGEMGAGDEFGADDEFGGEEDGEDEMMGSQAFESRRLREYSEKVGNDWEKNSQKGQGQIVGANTGEKMPSSSEGRSPISSGKGKPTTGASAGNILGDQKVGKGTNTGERPDSLNKGIAQVSGEKFASGLNNVDGKKSGVKTLSKVAGGHGAEKKGAAPGPVGSGSGDKAGQTSIDPATKRQFLPQNR